MTDRSSSYQAHLRELTQSTNMVTCSMSESYNGFTIHSAYYNRVFICRVELGDKWYYSKDRDGIKRQIRAFIKGENNG